MQHSLSTPAIDISTTKTPERFVHEYTVCLMYVSVSRVSCARMSRGNVETQGQPNGPCPSCPPCQCPACQCSKMPSLIISFHFIFSFSIDSGILFTLCLMIIFCLKIPQLSFHLKSIPSSFNFGQFILSLGGYSYNDLFTFEGTASIFFSLPIPFISLQSVRPVASLVLLTCTMTYNDLLSFGSIGLVQHSVSLFFDRFIRFTPL